jgi:hypothetical protein|tara:strand:+ start:1758 stop:2192 length:435 start_codon:yes stop_codon:yes gene_type:complete
MITLFVNRHTRTPEYTEATVVFAERKWPAIEPPWRDNEPFKSCIPTGLYSLQPRTSAKYKNHLVFIGGSVARTKAQIKHQGIERYSCLIHPANKANQLQGCLAIGNTRGEGGTVWGGSRKALNELLALMARFGQDSCDCVVRWV